MLDNGRYNEITAALRDAEDALTEAERAHRAVPARLPLALVNPGQQVLDTETKLIHHAIRISAFITATTLAREVRLHTGYSRADDEAHTLIRQILRHSGDIHPSRDSLTVRLDPLPTGRATRAAAELLDHLTTAQTPYPGTGLTLRYQSKQRPWPRSNSGPISGALVLGEVVLPQPMCPSRRHR